MFNRFKKNHEKLPQDKTNDGEEILYLAKEAGGYLPLFVV
jgi:hypothetical protein